MNDSVQFLVDLLNQMFWVSSAGSSWEIWWNFEDFTGGPRRSWGEILCNHIFEAWPWAQLQILYDKETADNLFFSLES